MLCAVCCVLYVQEEGRREAHLSCVDRGFTGRTYGSDAGERERHSHIPILCAVYCLLRGVWCVWCVVCQLCPILLTYTSFSPYIFTGLYSHMAAMQSKDQGRTWSDFVPIEPYSNTTTAQVSAYGSIVASGDGSRVFSLWIQNVNDVQNLPGKPPSKSFRADMLGR